jgi:hypothetical protein
MHARVRAVPATNHPVSRSGCHTSFSKEGSLSGVAEELAPGRRRGADGQLGVKKLPA